MKPPELRLEDRRLEADAVTVSFAPGCPAVDGASVSLTCGRVTALLGPSGSGKSTLLRAIAGLERLDAGAIRFEGRVWSGDQVHLPPEDRRCGVVFQDYALFPHLNALDNVAYGLKGARARSRGRDQALERALKLRWSWTRDGRGLPPRTCPAGSSSAWRWRAPWRRRPDVMLLDEPFSGLDRRLRAEPCARRAPRKRCAPAEAAAAASSPTTPRRPWRWRTRIALMSERARSSRPARRRQLYLSSRPDLEPRRGCWAMWRRSTRACRCGAGPRRRSAQGGGRGPSPRRRGPGFVAP